MSQKKSSRPWSFRTNYILNAIEKIQRFTKGMTFAEFDENRMAQDAVIRNFEIIGEAGNHILVSIQNKYPHIVFPVFKKLIYRKN